MRKIVVVSMAIVIASGAVALAQPGGTSTSQRWLFSQDDASPAPDDWNNPFGEPDLVVSTSTTWLDMVDNHQGVWPLQGAWPLTGVIGVHILNAPPNDYKEINIELVWKPWQDLTFLPEAPIVGVTPFDRMTVTQEDVPLDNDWVKTSYQITIWPNPTEEWITINGDIAVDELFIATECIPEPMTFALLGVGALGLLRRKRS